MSFAAASLSVPARSCAPSRTSRARNAPVFTSVPLCASAISTSSMAEMCGWAASTKPPPPLVE